VWGWGTPLVGEVRAEQAHAPTITFCVFAIGARNDNHGLRWGGGDEERR
jgi:hypothetical protein